MTHLETFVQNYLVVFVSILLIDQSQTSCRQSSPFTLTWPMARIMVVAIKLAQSTTIIRSQYKSIATIVACLPPMAVVFVSQIWFPCKLYIVTKTPLSIFLSQTPFNDREKSSPMLVFELLFTVTD